MAETWTGDMAGAQSEGVSVYQSVITQTYRNTGTVDLDGEERDLGAPQHGSARLTVVTITGTTQLLDVKLQHRELSTDSWADVAAGAFTQTDVAGAESLIINVHRFVRVVSNFTNTITAADYNVKLTLKT
jgi:hypothetical protein